MVCNHLFFKNSHFFCSCKNQLAFHVPYFLNVIFFTRKTAEICRLIDRLVICTILFHRDIKYLIALSELFSDSLQEESSVSEEMANHDVAF